MPEFSVEKNSHCDTATVSHRAMSQRLVQSPARVRACACRVDGHTSLALGLGLNRGELARHARQERGGRLVRGPTGHRAFCAVVRANKGRDQGVKGDSGSAVDPEAVKKALEPNVIEDNGILIGSLGLFGLWAALLGYALLLSPNQVPQFDMYLLRKFLNLEEPDGVSINTVFTSLFYVMGLWPLMYTALLVPAGKNKTVPAMPFVALSYGIGAFGLLPFMALWRPDGTLSEGDLPPSKDEVEGFGNVITRGMENRFVAYGILAGTIFCLGAAATAGAASWRDYGTLFFMSRFVHVTTVDFMTLTLLAPFWMENDARLRQWSGVGTWQLTGLQCLPVLGPAIYLCLRPVLEDNA